MNDVTTLQLLLWVVLPVLVGALGRLIAVFEAHPDLMNRLGRFKIPAPGEDREPSEQPLLGFAQEIVAPLQRRPQRDPERGASERQRDAGAAG